MLPVNTRYTLYTIQNLTPCHDMVKLLQSPLPNQNYIPYLLITHTTQGLGLIPHVLYISLAGLGRTAIPNVLEQPNTHLDQ